MKRAWFSGALAVFSAHLALFGLIVAGASVDWLMPVIVVMLLVVMNVAGVGAFITARQAPKSSLPLGLTMAPLTAALGTLSNLLFGAFGVRADLSGFYTNAGLLTMSLMYGMFVSIVGGAIGMWIGRREEAIAPVTPPPAVAQTASAMSAVPVEIKDDLPQIRSD
jgi:amino acid transporter